MEQFTFVDLFSGIGGFHQAMTELGGRCVFASDIDPFCNETYRKNYGIDPDKNIRDVNEKTEIPPHDVLCAGFPCQSFSKAGRQAGMEDDTRGTLFFDIARILRYHHSKYIILENVRNLVSHDHGNTWRIIRKTLMECGYRLTEEPLIVSPHQFGIPQLRERVIILGKYDPRRVNLPLDISVEQFKSKEENSIYDIVSEDKVDEKYYISEYEETVLQAWDEFYKGINRKIIGFPIWSQYFKYKLPPEEYPKWKQDFVMKNIILYQENKGFIDKWLEKYGDLQSFAPTHRKMEWQAGTSIDSVWEGVIQFRPSGVRVKTPTCFPSLVAMVQIPIIGKYKRRLTVEEAGRLQSFPNPVRKEEDMVGRSFLCHENDQQAYKQFGNSVNVEVIKRCAEKLFTYHDKKRRRNMLGIIGAMSEEVAKLKKEMSDVAIFSLAGMDFYQGKLKEKDVVVVQSGIGKVNAAICSQILVDRFKVTGIINTGVAGSLKNEINIGDIVLSKDTVQHDMDATGFGYEVGQIPRMDTSVFPGDEHMIQVAERCCQKVNPEIGVHIGRIVSGDQFISDKGKKEWLVKTFNGYCTEMEGAAIAQAAALNKIPFLIIRAISDKADDSAEMAYAEFEAKAIEHTVKLLLAMVDEL